MMFRPLLVCFLLAAPALSLAANKEMQELQRDVALLQQQIKDLQRSQDEKFAALTELARQAIEAANRASTGVAVISSNLDKSLKDQGEKVVAPVVGLGSRLDAMSGDMRSLQNAVTDLTSLMGRMQAQLSDLNTTMKLIQTPPAPPPQNVQGAGAGGAPGANETPPISAADLYANARRDYNSGKIDLALQEFADYLRWYGNTELAPNAQYYIAMAHYNQKNYDDAVKEFDMVLEKYPDNNKTGEALLYKGKALVASGRRTQGANEFQEVIARYPNTDQARMACAARIEIGLRCAAPPAVPRSQAKRGKK
jgi:tol-pal system protein YbgF